MEHGAPCDVTDSEGRLPLDVLPPEVAAIVNAHLSGNGFTKESATVSAGRTRL
jgi:hypothetical protein